MICIPITATTSKEALDQINQASSQADILELRLDYLTDLHQKNLQTLINANPIPKIITIRHPSEGGHFKGTEDQRLHLYNLAIAAQAPYIDIEFSAKIRPQNLKNTKLILSHHNFQNTPSLQELQALKETIKRQKPHIIKIVTTAKTPQDTQTIYQLLKAKQPQENLIVIAMGRAGVYTRITGQSLGSFLTFTALSEKQKSAEGQITLRELRTKSQNIALIGGRAVGKSHFAQQLAQKTGQYVIHLDQYIENLAQTKIPSIIQKYGWPHFRQLEYSALKEVIANHQGIIIDCGGGVIVEQDQNGTQTFSTKKAALLKKCHVIHLTTTLKNQKQRLITSPARPSLNQNQTSFTELEQIQNLRTPWYQKVANQTIET